MPLHERMIDQHDPDLDTIVDLQRSIMATVTYLMGRASLAELFGLQGYLSKLASQMTPPDVGNQRLPPMPEGLSGQLAEMEQRSQALRAMQAQANFTPAQYREARDVLCRETREG